MLNKCNISQFTLNYGDFLHPQLTIFTISLHRMNKLVENHIIFLHFLLSSYLFAVLQLYVGDLGCFISYYEFTTLLSICCFLFCFNYSSSAECSNCDHKAVRHFCWWNKVSYNSYTRLQLFYV